jgi:hypothetical protein
VAAQADQEDDAGSGSQVTFFALFVSPRALERTAVWFESPRLVVVAASRRRGTRPSRAAQTFAANLTKNMDQLLSHKRIGAEFRRLRALFLLGRVFGWAHDGGAPRHAKLLASYRTRTVRAGAVPAEKDLLLVANPRNPRHPRGLILQGGIHLSMGFSADNVDQLWHSRVLSLVPGVTPLLAKPESGGSVSPPGLLVERIVKNGRTLLRLDVSETLGLQRGLEGE